MIILLVLAKVAGNLYQSSCTAKVPAFAGGGKELPFNRLIW